MKRTHNINVAGGDLPADFSVKIDVTFAYEGCPIGELINRVTSGQSDRVRVQTMLRKKGVNELTRLALEGLEVRWDQIGIKSERSVVDILMALSLEEFVNKLVDDIGIDESKALEIFARKHGKDLDAIIDEYNSEAI